MKKVGIIILCLLAGLVVRLTIDKYSNNTYNTVITNESTAGVNSGVGSFGDAQNVGDYQGER